MDKKLLRAPVIVGALGYFVDIYDLVLFSIVRLPSLKDLGFQGADLMNVGVLLLNSQMLGMLAGGFFWGILGDKRGRRSVLFGSILIYSLANLANSWVEAIEVYALLRFVAGVGLAGELGAAITLVSETLAREQRGYGTAIVAGFGVLGAVFAGALSDWVSWRTSFAVGGVFGLLLLVTRMRLLESSMFEQVRGIRVSRGNLLHLFSDWRRGVRYLCSILIGVPIWYVVGVLMTFSPELTQEMGIYGVSAGRSILFCYLGLAFGDITSGFASQKIRSRKKVVFLSLVGVAVSTALYLLPVSSGERGFYFLSALLGFCAGYWAVFVTMAAENFGTNIRSTVAITVPNLVRASVVPLTLLFQSAAPLVGLGRSAMIVGMLSICLAFIGLRFLDESYHRHLNFLE